MDGAICMELLTPKGWSPATSIEGIIVSIQSHLVIGKGRLEAVVQMGRKKRERILSKMHAIENGKISDIINNDVSTSSVMEKSRESRNERANEGAANENQNERVNMKKLRRRHRRKKAKRGFIKRFFMNCLVNKGNLNNNNNIDEAEEVQATDKNLSQIAGGYTVNEAERSFQSIVKIHKKQGWSRSKMKS